MHSLRKTDGDKDLDKTFLQFSNHEQTLMHDGQTSSPTAPRECPEDSVLMLVKKRDHSSTSNEGGIQLSRQPSNKVID